MAGHAAKGDVVFAGRYADESGGRRVPERSLTVGVRPVAEGESCEVRSGPGRAGSARNGGASGA
ncbi:hypothetical protein PSD17_68250 [Pseudonocardia sp. D17]|nr:hypothetical protein PSD17_68250 [Pseudonocardia sp. D17]